MRMSGLAFAEDRNKNENTQYNMNRKHSNDPIPQIVDLGDGRFEFCYNHTQEQQENHIDYITDYVVCKMPVERQTVTDALIKKGHSQEEANQLTESL
jgi:hypothetical protein